MEVLLILLLLLIMGAVNAACFMIGAKVGQATAQGEETKLQAVTIEPVPEHQEQKESEKGAEVEKSWFDTVLQNIDNYDGTDQGQVDVPWR